LAEFQVVEQAVQLFFELTKACLAGKRLVGAVADENHRRFQDQRLFHQPLVPFLRRIEAGPGFAPNGVAAPTEVAEDDTSIGPLDRQCGLPVTITLLALDDGAADQDDSVAVEQLESGGRRGGRDYCKQQQESWHDLASLSPERTERHLESTTRLER